MTSTSRKRTVLFVTPLWNSRSTFYRWDVEHAGSRFDVLELHHVPGDRRFVDRCVRLALQSDAIVCWFTGAYALTVVRVAHAVGRRVAVIPAGYEVRTIKRWEFGLKMENEALYHRGIAALHHADLVIALSRNLEQIVTRLAEPRCVRLVYGGVDTSVHRPGEKKRNLVVLAAYVNKRKLHLKGVPTAVDAARFLPDVRFLFVGRDSDGCLESAFADVPPNFIRYGEATPDQYAHILGSAKVSLHISAWEGFGYATAQAMAAGCIPVISPIAPMPEVAGPFAEVAPFGNPLKLAEAITRALSRDDGHLFRERAVRMFDAARRREELCDAIEWLMR